MKRILNKLSLLFFPVPVLENLEKLDFSGKFISLSINKNLSAKISSRLIIQLEDFEEIKKQYVLINESNQIRVEFYNKDRLVSATENENPNVYQDYINQITELFQFSIENSKKLLSTDSIVDSDINSEAKGLEWIKVTLVVLKAAVEKSMKDSDLVFDGQFFYGKRASNETSEMRIQCLSLDFLLEFAKDGRLRVSAWNYKNLEPDPKAKPTFIGEFFKMKKNVFDEIIPLLVLMSKATTKIS